MVTMKQACVTAGVVVGTGLLAKTWLSKDEEEEVQGDWNAFWSLDESRRGAEIVVKDAPYAIEQEALDDLSRRLKNRRKLKSGAHGLKGVSLERLEAVLDHWENSYDWRLAERQLNSWNPKSAVVDGLEIRFLHIPAADQTREARPMLLLHGWPGSVWEFHKFIPEMQNKYKDLNLEFVVPSLPGYGWSEGSAKPGLGPNSMAVMFSKLMTKGLGYKSYWVQGGDWGGIIAAFLSSITPLGEVVGTHSNFPIVDRTPWDFAHAAFFEQDKAEVAKLLPISKVLSETMGVWPYMLFQMTRPHTLGYTLDASPEATAAYILDKIVLWSDPQSELTMDEIVTNLMFYWLPGSSTSAFELYAWLWESMGEAKRALVQPKTRPFGISMFPYEMAPPTRKAVRRTFTDLVSLSIAPRGGHFAALEEPAILAAHVSDFIHQLEKRGTTSSAT